MSGITGSQLFIRSLVEVSSDVIPFFWPMRNFIHHNPLYGLENIPFRDALSVGKKLFHARVHLPRRTYQRFLEGDKIDKDKLREEIEKFVGNSGYKIEGLDLTELAFTLLTKVEGSIRQRDLRKECCTYIQELSEKILSSQGSRDLAKGFSLSFLSSLGKEKTISEAVDLLFGTEITKKLNELSIRACMEFLDEGQAVWSQPLRRKGFYGAWREVALRDRALNLKGCCEVEDILHSCTQPEEAIELALRYLEVPKELWEHYFPTELAKLHGWTGYIRWRSHAREYYWQRRYPADLVDFLAVRLFLLLSLLKKREGNLPIEPNMKSLQNFVENRKKEAYLRYELFSKNVLPSFADRINEAIEVGGGRLLERLYPEYAKEKLRFEVQSRAIYLASIFSKAGMEDILEELGQKEVSILIKFFRELEEEEGYLWLRAHERTKIERLVSSLRIEEKSGDRSFAQALFCIDVRSERFRRNLEALGEYETYGIAGFFGVPVSFIELGKGNETYLCPVLIKPKNVVMELHREGESKGHGLVHVIKEILHDLKYNIFTPYITVEAIGLLFGFDMVGKTLFPLGYSRFREKLTEEKKEAKLLIDKLSKEEVYELIETLQREIVRRALKRELGLELSQEEVGKVREVALGNLSPSQLPKGVSDEFIKVLREEYKIDRGFTRLHIEKLAKIGFTIEEQAYLVEKALKMIGLTEGFGKFVLVIGHGSKSDNNPYESALDCGACGGDHGAVNARVFALMANKKEVRERLREKGINIPDDTHFLAGEHNTTTDEVEFFDVELVPATHVVLMDKLKEDLAIAGKKTARERCGELPFSECSTEEEAVKEILRNSVDWTQVRPEWGLSGNYAFIIGRRELTKRLNLRGKVFLHSYDYRIDPKGFYLENILSGPLVVGEWINMEHYFSAVDNEHFGSGSKVYHNVVGRFGVVSGNLSDLRTGLPAQTVLKGDMPFHEPVRLITLIEAPIELVKRTLKMVQKVRELVHNHWINLIVLDPESGEFYTYEEGEWKPLRCSDDTKHG